VTRWFFKGQNKKKNRPMHTMN